MKAVESVDSEVLGRLISEMYQSRLPQLKDDPSQVVALTELIAMSTFNKLYNLGVRSDDFALMRDRIDESMAQAENLEELIEKISEILYQDIRSKLVVHSDEDNDYVVYGMVDFLDGYSTRGAISNQEAYFWDYALPEGEWYFDPDDEYYSDMPNSICLFGRYEDPENEGSWFNYWIFLRPWGERWEDLDDYMLPSYYESWYLPLITAGEPMPDNFDGLE